MLEYTDLVKKRILERLTYPREAKEAGFQGTVKLKLHLSYQGELLEAAVEGPSGYKILDDNTIEVAKGIISYPAFPSTIDLSDLWVEIPIVYQLN